MRNIFSLILCTSFILFLQKAVNAQIPIMNYEKGSGKSRRACQQKKKSS